MDIALVLGILVVAILLFASEWIRIDMVSLMVLLALALTGLVSVEEAFSGFSNPAVITVAAMFVISHQSNALVMGLAATAFSITSRSEQR